MGGRADGNIRSLAICASDVDHLRIIGDYTDAELRTILDLLKTMPGGVRHNDESNTRWRRVTTGRGPGKTEIFLIWIKFQ